MEETKTLNSNPSQSLSPCTPSQESTETKHQNHSTTSSTPTPPPSSSVTRLWRPAAQRNLRNQWSKLASYRRDWASYSSSGRSHATSIVNSYLSQRYMDAMDLGVLSDMPDIRKKACRKLFKQQPSRSEGISTKDLLEALDFVLVLWQKHGREARKILNCGATMNQSIRELHRGKLLSCYEDMVAVVKNMVNTSGSMGCFLKGTSSSPLLQFSSCSEDKNDNGDGGGIPVFTFWSISSFEKLAQELVQMFALELNLKRLLVVELLSLCSEEVPINEFCWSDELYPGEFDDLSTCSLYSEEACKPILPKINDWKSDTPAEGSNHQPNHEILQVYLTTWLAEVNIDAYRVDEIFAVIGEEMHVCLS